MAPFLVPIVGMLAEKGMSLLSSAIEGGTDKAIEFVEEKTGIDLKTTKSLTPEQELRLKELEVQDRVRLKELALENKKEDNRHQETLESLEVGDVQNARGSEHLSDLQTKTADKIYTQTAWLIPMLLVIDTLLVMSAEKLGVDTTTTVAIANLIGIALNNAYRERQSIIEFLFGSSVGSKMKDKR